MRILTIANPQDEKFLRTKTAPFDFSKFSPKELNQLLANMRLTMKNHDGIGLAANQVGLNFQLFIVGLPNQDAHTKFYYIFNPTITEHSPETSSDYEGCLSVPNLSGLVKRSQAITVTAQNKQGKSIKLKVSGLLARVFQHEIDHLNGLLFIDKAKQVIDLSSNSKITNRRHD